jgi:hypothetical protein
LLLFDDLLGIDRPDAVPPRIDPDARQRRLTALVNAATLARKIYLVEGAHWIDEVSESMLADSLRRPAVSRSPATADWVGAAMRRLKWVRFARRRFGRLVRGRQVAAGLFEISRGGGELTICTSSLTSAVIVTAAIVSVVMDLPRQAHTRRVGHLHQIPETPRSIAGALRCSGVVWRAR